MSSMIQRASEARGRRVSPPAPANRAAVAGIKAMALRAITSSGISNLFRPFTRSAAVVFMLHRFATPGQEASRHDLASTRRLLEYLRRERHQLVDLGTLLANMNGEGPPLRHAVAFTIDDGYRESATVAGPLFAEFDCPVTTFVATGFLDRELWFWWDQINYILTHTERRSVSLEVGDGAVFYDLDANRIVGRQAAGDDFTARCKALTALGRREAIRQLAEVAEVAIPEQAPADYAPMSWDELRASERSGMTFGPHTVTHPLLASLSDDEAEREINQSWVRLCAEAAHPVPVFAYPNGQPGDFGERDYRILAKSGLIGAVTARAGFVTRHRYRASNGAFSVPRFPLPDSLPNLVQQVDGLERFKFLLRGVR